MPNEVWKRDTVLTEDIDIKVNLDNTEGEILWHQILVFWENTGQNWLCWEKRQNLICIVIQMPVFLKLECWQSR